MNEARRICAYYSKGRNFLEVLRAIKEHEPTALVQAMTPPSYPLSADERALADEVAVTERDHYSPWHVRACLRLVRQMRAGRYDGFVITFDSPQLRILSALAGARRRLYCTMDVRLEEVRPSIPAILASTATRMMWGHVVYAGIWLIVHLCRVPEREP